MYKRTKSTGGFTLIELMIVVVIVSILIGVALPAYQQQILKTKRGVARGELQTLLARQEQFFINNKQYASTLVPLGFTNPYAIDADGEPVAATSGSRTYIISITNVTGTPPTAFTLQAAPDLGQAKDRCGTLSITSAGAKAKTGSASDAECWP